MSHADQPDGPRGSDQAHDLDVPRRARRRWYQFGLSTLLGLVTLAAVGAWAWDRYLEPYRRQRQAKAVIEKLGGRCQTVQADDWLQRLLGQDLQNVTLVDVGGCDDPAAYLDHVAALPALETLAVGGSAFSDEHLARLCRAGSLRGLVLDGTSVTADGLESLRAALPQLDVYTSQHRTIAALEKLGTVAKMPHARHTQLCQLLGDAYFEEAIGMVTGTGFQDTDLILLKGLTKLEWLDLSDKHISDDRLAYLGRLTNLERLDLMRTQVSDAGLSHLKGLTNLQHLYLTGTQVSDAGLVHLKGLTKLQWLFLCGTQVSDAGLMHLKELTDLRVLSLWNTLVTHAGLVHLKGLTKLDDLGISETKVTPAGVGELKQAIPNCQVRR